MVTQAKIRQVFPESGHHRAGRRDETLMLDGEEYGKPLPKRATRMASSPRYARADGQPGKITDTLNISPVRVDGRMVGYRLNPGSNPELFNQLGLVANDMAVSINGLDLRDNAQAMQAMQAGKGWRLATVAAALDDGRFCLGTEYSASYQECRHRRVHQHGRQEPEQDHHHRAFGSAARINVRSYDLLNEDQYYQFFLSVLDVYGFAVVPMDNGVLKVVRSKDAKTSAIPLNDNAGGGNVVHYDPSNVLLITGRAAVVNRLVEVVRRVDKAGDQEVDIVKLKYASAGEMVRLVTNLNKDGNNQGGNTSLLLAPKVVADERTNSVVVSGEPKARARIIQMGAPARP
ncbi:UNVERIFIED_CONTAM: hypothetical protein K2H54_000275 [Gekko kuhli]